MSPSVSGNCAFAEGRDCFKADAISLDSLQATHFFKIKMGRIYDIESTGLTLPYGTKSGWE